MKIKTFLAALWLVLVAPLLSTAQHLTEYQPNGGLVVSSQVNLVSLQGSSFVDPVPGFTRSVNTLSEGPGPAAAPADVWFQTVNQVGIVVNSFRYGTPGIHEEAAALEVAPNGDYLVLANYLNAAGFWEIWIFRITPAGVLVWSNRYVIGPNNPPRSTKGYCIKRTNEPGQTYIIAGTTDNDKTLVAFKINGLGALLWSSCYADPILPNNVFDVPRSIIANPAGNIHAIAGNRRDPNGADIFTIGINTATGAIAIPYSYIDNNAQVDVNPFINQALNIPGDPTAYVLTYQTDAMIGGINTGRIAYTRLNAGLGMVLPATTYMYWEPNTLNSYGHTIQQLPPGPAVPGYHIGGGTTAGGVTNALSLHITPAGAPILYRRLWQQQTVISTYLLNDLAVMGAPHQYAHHNYKPQGIISSMLIFRDNMNCFIPLPVIWDSTRPRQIVRQYVQSCFVQVNPYPVPRNDVHGRTLNCPAGMAGVFREAGSKPVPAGKADPAPATGNGIAVYPSLLQGSSQLTVQWQAAKAGQQTINVYNLQSQLVLQRRVNTTDGINKISLDVSALKTGTFIVEVQGGEESFRTKIVKQ